MNKPDMKGWSAEQIKAYEAATAALMAEEDAARAAKEASPEDLIAAAQFQADAFKAERERAAREREDNRAFMKAVRELGGEHRVARVRTHEGAILLKPMSAAAWEEYLERISELKSEADQRRLNRQTIFETLVYPDRTRFDYLVDRFPFLWTHLYVARDGLIDGVQQEAKGKG